jgi:integrase
VNNNDKSYSKSAPESTRKRVASGLYRSESTGVYFAHVRANGKLHRESLRTDDRSLANRRLREFRRRVSRIDPGLSKTTLEAMCDLYLETIEHRSKSTKKGRLGIINRLKETFYGADCLPLGDIRPSQLESWLSKQASRLSASHYNTYITTLRDIFALAVRDRYIADNPCDALQWRKREQPIRLTPSFAEFTAIVADIRNQPFNGHDAEQSGDFVEFCGLAGLGQAEVAAIKRCDVDLDASRIIVFRHKTDTGFVIPVFPQLRPLIEKLCEGRKPNDRLFSIQQARFAIDNACKRLELPRYTHRSLRRMFITRCLELGIDVQMISRWQGHRDGGKLILDTYGHVSQVHSQRMAQLLATERPENVIAMPEKAAGS